MLLNPRSGCILVVSKGIPVLWSVKGFQYWMSTKKDFICSLQKLLGNNADTFSLISLRFSCWSPAFGSYWSLLSLQIMEKFADEILDERRTILLVKLLHRAVLYTTSAYLAILQACYTFQRFHLQTGIKFRTIWSLSSGSTPQALAEVTCITWSAPWKHSTAMPW